MGFDIMIREDETPILLEVNSAPSLTINHVVTNSNNLSESDQEELPKVRSVVDEVRYALLGFSFFDYSYNELLI